MGGKTSASIPSAHSRTGPMVNMPRDPAMGNTPLPSMNTGALGLSNPAATFTNPQMHTGGAQQQFAHGGRPSIPKLKKMPKVHAPAMRGAKLHTGPIHSSVAGRTDHLPMHVPSGSYVIPADIISAMGEGNTMAGFQHIKRMFGGTPYGGGAAPYGQSGGPYGSGSAPYGQSGGPYGAEMPKAAGGEVDEGVPIVAAGGEYVLSPEEVRHAGDGDLDAGHKALDEFVKRMRAKTVKTLSKLPGPKKD